MARTIKTPSFVYGLLHAVKINALPEHGNMKGASKSYSSIYEIVDMIDDDGKKHKFANTVLYVAKWAGKERKEWHAFYPNTGSLHYSYDKTIEKMADRAIKDAYKYA